MAEPRTKAPKSASGRAPSRTGTSARDDGPAEAPSTISQEAIARRAYEIAQGPEAGSDEENWLRAENELRRRSGRSG